MIHSIYESEWMLPSLDSTRKYLIPMPRVFSYIELNKIKSEDISILDIKFKDLSNIDKTSIRYKKADVSYPIIVLSGLKDYDGKVYRMIDGRHRLLKSMDNKSIQISAYIIPWEEVLRFVEIDQRKPIQ